MYKKKFIIIILLFVAIIPVSQRLSAQINSDWQFIGLTIAGDNKQDGVEAFYQINKCNGKDVIYIKYINHNEYPVKLEWFDAVFTQELKWVRKERMGDRKTIIIPAKVEVKGECPISSGEVLKTKQLNPELFVEAKDFLTNIENFKRYSASDLTIIAVQ